MGNNGMNCCNAQPQQQAQQVFGKLDVQQQYVNIATGRKGRKIVTVLQDFYVPSKTSIRNFSPADLDSKKMTVDGKSISFAEHAKQSGGQFFVDGEGRTIFVNKQGSKHVLDATKNEWVAVNKFYGDKGLEVSGNLNQAQKASFIERYALVMGPNGKYQSKDPAKDSRTYDFDLSGGALKVKLSEGMVMVEGKPVESKKPYIFENGEWRIDEKSNTVLREDLDTEVATRTAETGKLANALGAEITERKAGDEANATAITTETGERKAGDEKLTSALNSGLSGLATVVKAGDEKLGARIVTEAGERKAGDEKLKTALNSGLSGLATEVKNGDEKLGARITGETAKRKAGDEKLTTKLTTGLAGLATGMKAGDEAEAAARAKADETEATARKTGDETEKVAREQAITGVTTNVERVAEAVKNATEGLTANSQADEERQCVQEGEMYQLKQENAELAKTNAELAKKIERIQLLLELQQASPSPLQQPPAAKKVGSN
jgi:hypothetical protein